MVRRSDGIVEASRDGSTTRLENIERVAFDGSPEVHAGFGAGTTTLNLSAFQMGSGTDEFVILYRVPDGVNVTAANAVRAGQSQDGTYTWTVPIATAHEIVLAKTGQYTGPSEVRLGAQTSDSLGNHITGNDRWREELVTEVTAIRLTTNEGAAHDRGVFFGQTIAGEDGDAIMVYSVMALNAQDARDAISNIQNNGTPIIAGNEPTDEDGLTMWDRSEVSNIGAWRMLWSSAPNADDYEDFELVQASVNAEQQIGPVTFFGNTHNATGYGAVIEDGEIMLIGGAGFGVTMGVKFAESETSFDGGRTYLYSDVTTTANGKAWAEFRKTDSDFVINGEISAFVYISLSGSAAVNAGPVSAEGTGAVSLGVGAKAKATGHFSAVDDYTTQYSATLEAWTWAGPSARVSGVTALEMQSGKIGVGGQATKALGAAGIAVGAYGEAQLYPGGSGYFTIGLTGALAIGFGLDVGLEFTMPANPVLSIMDFVNSPADALFPDEDNSLVDEGPFEEFMVA